ncbi:MAG TPA: phosphoribosyltransferase [Gemmatimonadaceae bacterium]|nr:phosphoribosyltransferase [Gemmatimonadaceae bacterium]
MATRFKDRTDAGRQLAERLAHLRDEQPIVLALPRGGVPVAYEVAHALHAPLDVLNVRKLGVPWQEELAMGAIATGGVRVLNNDVIMNARITTEMLEQATALQRLELDRRERLYRSGRPAPDLRGRTVVLVDDGVATGATTRAAIAVIRAQAPARLVLAVPVAQDTVAAELARAVDELVCVTTPGDLYAIGAWYDAFPQLSDAEVQRILMRAAAEPVHAGEAVREPDGEEKIPVT